MAPRALWDDGSVFCVAHRVHGGDFLPTIRLPPARHAAQKFTGVLEWANHLAVSKRRSDWRLSREDGVLPDSIRDRSWLERDIQHVDSPTCSCCHGLCNRFSFGENIPLENLITGSFSEQSYRISVSPSSFFTFATDCLLTIGWCLVRLIPTIVTPSPILSLFSEANFSANWTVIRPAYSPNLAQMQHR